MSSTDQQHSPTAAPTIGTRPERPERPAPEVRRFQRVLTVVVTVVTAVLVNLVVWAVGAIAGGSFEFTDDGEVYSAAPGGVVLLTALPLAIGMTAAALVSRRWPGMIRVAQVVGPALAVATIGLTLTTDFDTTSTITLSVTHLTLVPIMLVGLEVLRRSALAAAHGAEDARRVVRIT